MTTRQDPVELRVLAALAAGSSTPAEVAAAVTESEADAARILDWAVGQQLATRMELASGPSYTLTPQGLQDVAVRQRIAGATGPGGRVDFTAATELIMDGYQAARESAVEEALREQAGWLANDGVRDRVSAALNDAYARGALTTEELDARTTAALSATTMGELRAAGDGVIDLPPLLDRGIGYVGSTGAQPQITVSPGVAKAAGAFRSLFRRRDGDQPAADE